MDRLLEATYRAEQRHFWFQGFRRFVRPLVAEAVAGRAGATILDCGCGTGANLTMLADYGRPFGIDLTWLGLQYARQNGQPRLAHASVTHLPFVDASFDLATSFDVLYCLEEPQERAAVGEMFRVLKPGGAAIVNVAALDILRGGQSVVGGEVRRYTTNRLRWALETAGFRVVRLTYTNATLFPLILAVRLTERLTGRASQEHTANLTVPPGPVNHALTTMLGVEARLLRRLDMPIGSSVLCLARKPA
jgi:ubiquinone/menaquinone biosynthesis C-methylase UbiE